MSIPFVSIIMPAYNCIDVIGNSIDSVLNQTYTHWEMIIVDDASTDGTAEFVRTHYSDERIHLHTMPANVGSGACRNFAISVSTGRYIAVLDADDECFPTRLEKQLLVFESDPDADVVASQIEEFGDWGGPLIGQWPTDKEAISKRQKQNKMPVAHPTVMFRRELFDVAGGYDPACRRAQDFALFLKLHHRKIVCVDEALVKYRTQRPVSIKYALTNQVYSELALRRHHLRCSGVPESDLPTTPAYRPSSYLLAFRGWFIRTVREYAQGLA